MRPGEYPDYAWSMSQQPLDKIRVRGRIGGPQGLGPGDGTGPRRIIRGEGGAEIRRQQAMSPGPGMSQTFIPAQQARSQRHNRSYSPMGLAITSMVLAIPLTAIALIFGGPLMGILVWAGIVGINFAAALGNFKLNDPSSR